MNIAAEKSPLCLKGIKFVFYDEAKKTAHKSTYKKKVKAYKRHGCGQYINPGRHEYYKEHACAHGKQNEAYHSFLEQLAYSFIRFSHGEAHLF